VSPAIIRVHGDTPGGSFFAFPTARGCNSPGRQPSTHRRQFCGGSSVPNCHRNGEPLALSADTRSVPMRVRVECWRRARQSDRARLLRPIGMTAAESLGHAAKRRAVRVAGTGPPPRIAPERRSSRGLRESDGVGAPQLIQRFFNTRIATWRVLGWVGGDGMAGLSGWSCHTNRTAAAAGRFALLSRRLGNPIFVHPARTEGA